MSLPPLLPPRFYARDSLVVAQALLGMWLCHGEVVLRITEVEAYRDGGDTANHCRKGITSRNAPMWGPPGHAYIYLCYGMHNMLNLVTDADGVGAAVLVRSAEPVRGEAVVEQRRFGRRGPAMLTGPGKLAAALGLDRSFNNHPVYEPGGLEVRQGQAPEQVLVGPRVGINYAAPEHRDAPWRLAVAGTPWVSHRRGLRLS